MSFAAATASAYSCPYFVASAAAGATRCGATPFNPAGTFATAADAAATFWSVWKLRVVRACVVESLTISLLLAVRRSGFRGLDLVIEVIMGLLRHCQTFLRGAHHPCLHVRNYFHRLALQWKRYVVLPKHSYDLIRVAGVPLGIMLGRNYGLIAL